MGHLNDVIQVTKCDSINCEELIFNYCKVIFNSSIATIIKTSNQFCSVFYDVDIKETKILKLSYDIWRLAEEMIWYSATSPNDREYCSVWIIISCIISISYYW